jgi:SAM-dependent methyltransferase
MTADWRRPRAGGVRRLGARALAGLGTWEPPMPDPLIRPTAHDRVFRRYVLESPASLRLLNVGSGERAPLALPNVINLDITPAPLVHVLGDAHALPFRGESFGGVVCRAVLEHVREPALACRELFRVLEAGGFVLATVPFIFPYHAHPDDYQRFTASGLRVLFRDFEEIECGIGRLPTAAVLSTLSAYAATFSDHRLVSGFLRWSVAWLLNPLKYLDHLLKRKRNARLLSSYYFLGRKPAGRAAAGSTVGRRAAGSAALEGSRR